MKLRPIACSLLWAAAVALGGGCASPAPTLTAKVPASVEAPAPEAGDPQAAMPADGAATDARVEYIGEIVRVNAAEQYVVVRCKRLPRAGEEARVERKMWQKGRIRFAGPVHSPYAAADILRGEIEPGDAVMR